MILRQTLHTSPVIASSYFTCGSRHVGCVVDPVADTPSYLVAASALGMRIGFERRFNKAFAIDDRHAFVEAIVHDIPAPPPSAAANRIRNLGRQQEAARMRSAS
jgi:hypothetical protein